MAYVRGEMLSDASRGLAIEWFVQRPRFIKIPLFERSDLVEGKGMFCSILVGPIYPFFSLTPPSRSQTGTSGQFRITELKARNLSILIANNVRSEKLLDLLERLRTHSIIKNIWHRCSC